MPAYITGININARVTDGSVTQHIGSNIGVDINPVNFELMGTKYYYGGTADYSMADGYTSYLYFSSDGYLHVNTSTYPITPHIRLARVIASGGTITNIVDDRIFLFSAGVSTVISHAPQHEQGGGDPILVESLGTAGLKGRIAMSDGSGGLDMKQSLGSRVLLVGSDFEYPSLKSALAAAAYMYPSQYSPIAITIAPGMYVEDNSTGPIELLDNVYINSLNSQGAILFVPMVPDNFLFRSSPDGSGSLGGVGCVGCSGATGGAILIDRGTINLFPDIIFVGCSTCVRATGAGVQAVFSNTKSISCYNVFLSESGAAVISSNLVAQDIIGVGFNSLGGVIQADSFTFLAMSGVGAKGCVIDYSGFMQLKNGIFVGCYTAVECSGSTTTRLDLIRIEDSDVYDILINSGACTVKTTSCEFAASKVYNPYGAGFYGQYRDSADAVFKIAGSLDMIGGNATWKGFPRMTDPQQTSMIAPWGVPEGGRSWFNTTLNKFAYWDGYAAIYIKPNQVVTVGKAGADFTSIRLAINSITDASRFKPYTVIINAGIYVELPIVLKSYVALQALGKGSCIIMAANNAAPLITMNNYSEITDLTFMGPTGNATILVDNIPSCAVSNCFFQVCQTGIHATGAISQVYVNSCSFLTTGLLITNALLIENKGSALVKNVLVYAANGCKVNDGYVTVQGSDFINCTNAFYADNSGTIELSAIDVEGCTYGVRTGLVGENYITGIALTFDGYSVYDVYQEASGSVISLGSCFISNENISVVNWDEVFLTYDSDKGGEIEHFIIRGLNVGVPEKGRYASIGHGLSYSRGMIVYTTNSLTGPIRDGGNIQDVTLIARNDILGEFTFQGLSDGHTILIGSDLEDGCDNLKHWGVRIEQVIGAVEDVKRSFGFEIWNGSSWVEVQIMGYDRDELYKYSNEIFLRANSSERILFGIDNDTLWQKKTINGKNLYWSRIMIKNTVETLPTFNRFWLAASSVNFNTDGFLSFLGRSRFKKTLQSVGNSFGESGGIVSSNISVGTGGDPTGWSHEVKSSTFTNINDAITYQFVLPHGIDTSMPLSLSVCYSVPVAGTGNATLVASFLPIEIQGVLEADPTGGIPPVNRSLANTETINANSAQILTNSSVPVTTINKLQTVVFSGFDISNYYSDDLVVIRLKITNRGGASTKMAIWEVNILGTMCSLG